MQPLARWLFLLSFFLPSGAFARDLAALLSPPEFLALARDAAPKVNLFHDIWRKNPAAELFGGTSRDYLYWIKGHFKRATTRAEVRAIRAALLARTLIDVREFIIGDSDVDVLSAEPLDLDPAVYGLKKIDLVDTARLDRTSPLGITERRQGYIPLEKIRIGQSGVIAWRDFGDGALEILNGKPTVHFASEDAFWETHYAKLGINDPVLLVARYLRTLAMNYFYEAGSKFPDAALFNIDRRSDAAVRAAVQTALTSEKLSRLLKTDEFRRRFDDTIQKVFRSYTNPTAARELFGHYGLDLLWQMHAGLQPLNQYLFARRHDSETVARFVSTYQVSEKDFFSPARTFFPDLKLYHGTRTESAFRSILFQGTFPSQAGTAGYGLYGVALRNLTFAEDWAQDRDRVVVIDVEETARVVDITHGEGRRVFQEWQDRYPSGDETAFAIAFGIDIVRYPYDTEAFVVKNSAVLGKPNGLTRRLVPSSEILARAIRAATDADLKEVGDFLVVNNLTLREEQVICKALMPLLISFATRATTLAEMETLYSFPIDALDFGNRIFDEALALVTASSTTTDFAHAGKILRKLSRPQSTSFLETIENRVVALIRKAPSAKRLAQLLDAVGLENLSERQRGSILYAVRGLVLALAKRVQTPAQLVDFSALAKWNGPGGYEYPLTPLVQTAASALHAQITDVRTLESYFNGNGLSPRSRALLLEWLRPAIARLAGQATSAARADALIACVERIGPDDHETWRMLRAAFDDTGADEDYHEFAYLMLGHSSVDAFQGRAPQTLEPPGRLLGALSRLLLAADLFRRFPERSAESTAREAKMAREAWATAVDSARGIAWIDVDESAEVRDAVARLVGRGARSEILGPVFEAYEQLPRKPHGLAQYLVEMRRSLNAAVSPETNWCQELFAKFGE